MSPCILFQLHSILPRHLWYCIILFYACSWVLHTMLWSCKCRLCNSSFWSHEKYFYRFSFDLWLIVKDVAGGLCGSERAPLPRWHNSTRDMEIRLFGLTHQRQYETQYSIFLQYFDQTAHNTPRSQFIVDIMLRTYPSIHFYLGTGTAIMFVEFCNMKSFIIFIQLQIISTVRKKIRNSHIARLWR